jgi:hypothetical protein
MIVIRASSQPALSQLPAKPTRVPQSKRELLVGTRHNARQRLHIGGRCIRYRFPSESNDLSIAADAAGRGSCIFPHSGPQRPCRPRCRSAAGLHRRRLWRAGGFREQRRRQLDSLHHLDSMAHDVTHPLNRASSSFFSPYKPGDATHY